jgi:DNA-binding XRE family transcriptional regulator
MEEVRLLPQHRASSYQPRPDADKELYRLTRQLIAARGRAGLTQQQVALRLRTTKSAISRLERGLLHRPTLTTIESYALVVGCRVEVRLLPWP